MKSIILAVLVGVLVSGPAWGQAPTEFVYDRCFANSKRFIVLMEDRVSFCRCSTPIVIEHLKPEALEAIRRGSSWLPPLGQAGLSWPFKNPEAFALQVAEECPDIYRFAPGAQEGRG